MYRNSEGYADPTAGKAIARICAEERRRKRRKPSSWPNRPFQDRTTYWIQVWPKENAGTMYIENKLEK